MERLKAIGKEEKHNSVCNQIGHYKIGEAVNDRVENNSVKKATQEFLRYRSRDQNISCRSPKIRPAGKSKDSYYGP
jgi:hypothetical protein